MGVEPTKLIAATSGLCSSASTATLSPCRTLKTPSGRPGLGPQAGHPEGGGGVLLAGLEDDGVARGDRQREEPHRHHGREVEGADDADDAERLPDRVHVDARRDALGVAALEQVGHAARELHDLEAAGDLAEGVGVHLAVLAGDDRGELVLAGLQQLAEAEHHPGPGGDRDLPPGVGGPAGGGDHGVRVGLVGEHHPPGDLPGGRIGHVEGPIRRSRPLSTIEPVVDRADFCGIRRHGTQFCTLSAEIGTPGRRNPRSVVEQPRGTSDLGGRATARNERPRWSRPSRAARVVVSRRSLRSLLDQRDARCDLAGSTPRTNERTSVVEQPRGTSGVSRPHRPHVVVSTRSLRSLLDQRTTRRPRWSSSREERALCRDLAKMRTAATPLVGERPPFGACGYEVT